MPQQQAEKTEKPVFISDKKTFVKAQALINVYGNKATLKAGEMARECKDKGFIRSQMAWQQILDAVELLLDDHPRGSVH